MVREDQLKIAIHHHDDFLILKLNCVQRDVPFGHGLFSLKMQVNVHDKKCLPLQFGHKNLLIDLIFLLRLIDLHGHVDNARLLQHKHIFISA